MPVQNALQDVPANLWRMVHLAQRRLLMLDYDGTLAPYAVERMDALPQPRALNLLRLVAGSARTQVALVSGRPLREVERLVGPLPASFVGEHGWEFREPKGMVVRRPMPRDVERSLDMAERAARKLGGGKWIERKRTAVVLHIRGCSPEIARGLRQGVLEAWSGVSDDGRLVLDDIPGGLELRAFGRNKGTAVISLLSQSGPGTLGVFVGDDVSDEDAFEVIRDWGFGILVGPADQPTKAQGRLPSQEAIADFLEEWLRVTGTAYPNRPL